MSFNVQICFDSKLLISCWCQAILLPVVTTVTLNSCSKPPRNVIKHWGDLEHAAADKQ